MGLPFHSHEIVSCVQRIGTIQQCTTSSRSIHDVMVDELLREHLLERHILP